MKTVSNNDVAVSLENKKYLEERARTREILQQPADTSGVDPNVKIGTTPIQVPELVDNLWDLQKLEVPYLWMHYGTKGEGVKVHVLDSGVDVKHPAFRHCKGSLEAKSFIPTIDNPEDQQGHGTWVCGKICGRGVGLAPKAQVVSAKVLDGSGTGLASWTVRALASALKDPPHLINISLGGQLKSVEQEKLIWKLYQAGTIVVVASGNNGAKETFYPADYDGVVVVGAVDKNSARAKFSNYGLSLKIVAPGVACYSAHLGHRYATLDGTSMATPTVTGLLALGIGYALKRGYKYGPALRDLVLSSLYAGAERLGDPKFYGYGGLDGPQFLSTLDGKLNESSNTSSAVS